MAFPKPANENKRLEALRRYHLLDTPAEEAFDDFVRLATHVAGTPIALITLVDEERQWFKANVGMEGSETPREQAFCAHTILTDEVMVVEDARIDARFASNPLVTAGPKIRFYAGAPLTDADGFALGSICVIDRAPRQLSDAQREVLEALARCVVRQFELRRASADLAVALEEVKTLRGILPICAHCKSVRNDSGYWSSLERYLATHTEADLSHGICPTCLQLNYPEQYEELLAAGKIKPAPASGEHASARG